MSETAWILSAGFALLLAVGVPFSIALLLTVAAVLLAADIEPVLLAQTLIAGTQSFSLLAIPFFMLAGEIMTGEVLTDADARTFDLDPALTDAAVAYVEEWL
ncbi:MAG: TRAP transporter large permease subunit, partial [Burkholderiales bacterium]